MLLDPLSCRYISHKHEIPALWRYISMALIFNRRELNKWNNKSLKFNGWLWWQWWRSFIYWVIVLRSLAWEIEALIIIWINWKVNQKQSKRIKRNKRSLKFRRTSSTNFININIKRLSKFVINNNNITWKTT